MLYVDQKRQGKRQNQLPAVEEYHGVLIGGL